jgi:hypothetical protein
MDGDALTHHIGRTIKPYFIMHTLETSFGSYIEKSQCKFLELRTKIECYENEHDFYLFHS